MSIVSEVSRLKTAKGKMKASIIGKGVPVPDVARMSDYSGYIDQIQVGNSGTDTSDATAVSGDLLLNKTAYVKGSKITGSIQTYTGSTSVASNTSSAQTLATQGKYMTSNIIVNKVDPVYVSDNWPYYSGPTTVDPKSTAQTLYTSGYRMSNNITINAQTGGVFQSVTGAGITYGDKAIEVQCPGFYPRVVCYYAKWSSTYRHGFYFEGINYCQGNDDTQLSRTFTISKDASTQEWKIAFVPNGTNGKVWYWIGGTPL